MSSILRVLLLLGIAGCGHDRASDPAPGPTTTGATPTAPAPAPTPSDPASTDPAPAPTPDPAPVAIDPATLADLDDLALTNLRLTLKYQGAPVGPQTRRGEYMMDAESFEHRGLGPDGKVGPLGARKTGASLRYVVEAIRRHGIAARGETPDPGCTGGSTYILETKLGDQVSTLRAYRCGGDVTGTLAGDVEALVADLEWLLPDARRSLPRE